MGDSLGVRASEAKQSTVFESLARAGYVADGLVHLFIGGVAIAVALGTDEGTADTNGALEGLADHPVGLVVLALIALTLFALALWQWVTAVAIHERGARGWAKRVPPVGKGIAFAAVGASATVVALGGHSNQDESSRGFSSWLLATPGGVFVLLALGAGIAITGIVFIVIGAGRRFVKTIRRPRGPGGPVLIGLGVAGYIAKGIAIGIVGALFIVAGLKTDPNAAGGLDAALRSLLALPLGVVLLIAVGAGLQLYGVFFVFRARFAKL